MSGGHRLDGSYPSRRMGAMPYGTNEGDVWLAGELLQERVQEDKGPQWRVVKEMLRRGDGEVQEVIYVTENPELVERADRGHELYVAQRAQSN